jgi:hypothetical protein
VQDIVVFEDHFSPFEFKAKALNAFKLLPLEKNNDKFRKMLQALAEVETPGAVVKAAVPPIPAVPPSSERKAAAAEKAVVEKAAAEKATTEKAAAEVAAQKAAEEQAVVEKADDGGGGVGIQEPPTVLLLRPHKDAAPLAYRIKNLSKHEPRYQFLNVKPQKTISKIVNHLKSKWKVALGVNASRLVLKDKSGFLIPMDWMWSQLCTHQQGNVELEYMLTDDSAAGASTLQVTD